MNLKTNGYESPRYFRVMLSWVGSRSSSGVSDHQAAGTNKSVSRDTSQHVVTEPTEASEGDGVIVTQRKRA